MTDAARRWWWVGAAIAVWSIASLCAAQPAEIREISGTLTSVDALSGRVGVDTEMGPTNAVEHVECVIDGDTVISKYGVHLGVADLQPSVQRVKVQLIPQGNAMLARRILFERPAGWQRFSGTVAAVDLLKGELAVRPTGLLWFGSPKTFAFDEQTLIAQGAHQRYLTDLRAGQEVRIEYRMENAIPIATLVSLPEPPHGRGLEKAGSTTQPRGYTPGAPVNP